MHQRPGREEWTKWIERAVRAPSGGNVQAWRFVVARRDGTLRCYLDPVRAENFLDFELSASHVALGAAVESLVLVAGQQGYHAQVEVASPNPEHHVCTVRLTPQQGAQGGEDALLAAEVPRRATNRRMGSGKPLPEAKLTRLDVVAQAAGATLQRTRAAEAKRALAEVVGGCDRIRMYSPRMHRELVGELRWTPEEAERTGDGVDLRTLEANAVQRFVVRGLASFRVIRALRRLGLGGALEGMGAESVEAASEVALLTVPGVTGDAFFAGGRALQRVWLTTSALGIGFQPLAVPPYLFVRLLRGDGLTDSERADLHRLRAKFDEVFAVPADHAEVMLFRLTDAPPPSTPSLRKPVQASLVFE